MEPTRSILLCEEDAATRAFLADNLAADGYHVLPACTQGRRARRAREPASPTWSSATSTATRSS